MTYLKYAILIPVALAIAIMILEVCRGNLTIIEAVVWTVTYAFVMWLIFRREKNV
jgi:Ca2+/Na+ antiporter